MELITRGFLILLAIFFSLSAQALHTAAPVAENFEGPYVNRNFNIVRYTTILRKHVTEPWGFRSFDALLGNPKIQWAIADSSKRYKTQEIVRIHRDPLNPSNRVLWVKATCCARGQTDPRIELHYAVPFDSIYQPYGTKYTLAFRFYTPDPLKNGTRIMQSLSEFPWLQLSAEASNTLRLRFALCKTDCSGDKFLYPSLKLPAYKIGAWNTVVLHILHSNSNGRIDVYVNGAKRTYIGRTVAKPGSTRIGKPKFGVYGTQDELYIDDLYSWPGFIQPFGRPFTQS
jgi:hypothetical protein